MTRAIISIAFNYPTNFATRNLLNDIYPELIVKNGKWAQWKTPPVKIITEAVIVRWKATQLVPKSV